MTTYPVNDILPDFLRTLEQGNRCVLSAPPGAGKTTILPPTLLDAPWRQGKKILVLEPRRLAAYAAACRMAENLGEKVGQRIGYRIRLDHCVGPDTVIEVLTEGILTRMIQNDPELSGVAAILFDEFHERSLHADLGLALALDAQQSLRPDLRLVIMSATIDCERIAALLDPCPMLHSDGRMFDVQTIYRRTPVPRYIEDTVAETAAQALRDQPGSMLVFLPGEGAIARTAELLREPVKSFPDTQVIPLYGRLRHEEQRRAIAPCRPGERKIVLATSIAETSLTIDGVRIVIDSGLARRNRFDPSTGLSRLETGPVSQASADQRRGRAGRVEPGVCYRLWTPEQQHALPAFNPPEILTADLAPLVLELAAWGVTDPQTLRWLDPPPDAPWQQAVKLLRELDALDRDARITPTGKRLLRSGLHPRLAHMLGRSEELGLTDLACDLAALLSEYDFRKNRSPDLRDTLGRLSGREFERVRELAEQLRHQVKANQRPAVDEDAAAGLLLAFAYPDRIGKSREPSSGKYRLTSGRGAVLSTASLLARSDLIVAAELDAGDRDAAVYLAAPVAEADLRTHFAAALTHRQTLFWDDPQQRFRCLDRECLGKMPLVEKEVPAPDGDAAAQALLEFVRDRGFAVLNWTPGAVRWRDRIRFLRAHDPSGNWPDWSDDTLLDTLENWLLPHCPRKLKRGCVEAIDVQAALLDTLDWHHRQAADALAPERIEVPTGSHLAVDYSVTPPVLAVKLQEMFGCAETPRLVRGQVPVLLHLLSPAGRPVQVTSDLGGFWQGSYQYVRSELRGRYPKHDWPENPLEAAPSRGAKKRKISS